MTIELVTAFFGQGHLRMFLDNLCSTLEQPSNLPELKRRGVEIVHRIYCTTNEAGRIPPQPLASADETIIDIELLHCEEPSLQRDAIHIPYREAIRRGDCVTILAQADHVFGCGFADAIAGENALKPGEYLVVPHPRIVMETALPHIKAMVETKPTNEEWVTFFMDLFPHPLVARGKATADPYWRTTRRADHWETYFQEPPPLAFWGTPDMLQFWPGTQGNLEVLDHQLVNYCFEQGRLKTIMDSRVFTWAELTPAKVYRAGIPARSEHLASCQFFNRTPARWYFK